MTIQPDDVLEASARSEFDGTEDVVNVFQFKLTSLLSLTDQEGVDDILEFLEAVYTIWRAVQSAMLYFRDVRIRNITQSEVLGTYPWPTLINGAQADNPAAPGVAGLVNWSTKQPKITLRKYVGGVTEAGMGEDGLFASGYTTAIANGAFLLINPYIATNGTWTYGHDSPVALEFVTPTLGVVLNIPAYQRRRKQGRGS